MEYASPAEAEKWFRRAAEIMPYEKDINYGLYQCLERLGKREEAAAVRTRLNRIEADIAEMDRLTRLIGSRPHDPALRYEAGKVLLRNGQEAEGLRWLESALREDPQHAATHQTLAEYYEKTGDAEKAAYHRRLVPPTPAGTKF
jgi:Tfp pilus assembly protein PilF